MGWNTVVVLLNDLTNEWPESITTAARAWSRNSRNFCERGWFGFGQVASMDHADGRQVVVAGGNTARALTPMDPADEADLEALSMVLKGHGYTVRRPGRKRAEGPLSWGYAAKQAASAPQESRHGE